MIGFTYNGVHSSKYNCWFIPARNEWFGMEAFEAFGEESSGNGGYYFGNRATIRPITMKCFVEDATIAQKRAIQSWLGKDTSGELVTDDRPWVSYKVRPVKSIVMTEYTQRNGVEAKNLFSATFTITFSAYEPYGVQTNKSYTRRLSEANYAETPNMLPEEKMPPLPQVDSQMFLLYNCGDVRTGLTIRLAGDVGDGISFYNSTTKQQCRVHNLIPDDLYPGQYLEINGDKGTVFVLGGADNYIAYEYHDDGYLELEPNRILLSNVRITSAEGSPDITSSSKVFTDELVGAYILIGDEWQRVFECASPTSITLVEPAKKTGTYLSMAATMNEIYVTSSGAYGLSMLEVDYSPKIR